MKYWKVSLIEHHVDGSNHTEKEIESQTFNTLHQADMHFDDIADKILDEYKYKIMFRVFQENENYISTERKNGTYYVAKVQELVME